MTAQPYGEPEESVPEEARRRDLPQRPAFAPAAVPARDEVSVRWSPVFAGLLTALGINLVVYTLGAAIGLSVATPTAGNVGDVLRGAAIWSAVGWLVALFVGGYLAGRLGTYLGLRRGVLQGTVLWALYLFLWLMIGASGLAGALGAMNINPATANAAGGANPSTADIARALNAASATSWSLFAAMVLGWVAAIGGGLLGVRSLEKSEPRPVR